MPALRRVLLWVGVALGALVAAVAVLAVVARFSDGPLGPLAGGPLERGPLVRDPGPDWSFVREVGEIELQLLEPPRSRTVWVVEHEGAIYVPCGYTNHRWWKQWAWEALEDGRALLRIEGKRYEREAVRVADPALERTLRMRLVEKYDLPRTGAFDPEHLWFFRMDPRRAS